jgi:hypothetical protein
MANPGNLPGSVGGSGALLVALTDESGGQSVDVLALGGSNAIAVAIVDGSGNQQGTKKATATNASVAGSASAVTLQASNTARESWSCFNDSTATLYVKFGATASTSDFKVKLLPGGYYEMAVPVYTGIITGLWDSATGNARVSET